MVNIDSTMAVQETDGGEVSVATAAPKSFGARFSFHNRMKLTTFHRSSQKTSKERSRMSATRHHRRIFGGPRPSTHIRSSGPNPIRMSLLQKMLNFQKQHSTNNQSSYNGPPTIPTRPVDAIIGKDKKYDEDEPLLEQILAGGGISSSLRSTTTLPRCISLLESDDEDKCRIGLQQLKNILIEEKKKKNNNNNNKSSLSYALIYDDNVSKCCDNGDYYCRARNLLASFLCSGVDVVVREENVVVGEESSTDDETISHDDEEETKLHVEEEVDSFGVIDPTFDILNIELDDDDDGVDFENQWAFASFSYDSDEEIEEEDADYKDDEENGKIVTPQGRYLGDLHGLALDIVILALEYVIETQLHTLLSTTPTDGSSPRPSLDFGNTSRFWRPVVTSLIQNIEVILPETLDICASSIHCLLLLHELEPSTIQPLAQGTLFPYLVQAQDEGEVMHHAKLEYCALQLLQRVDRFGTTTTTTTDNQEKMETHVLL